MPSTTMRSKTSAQSTNRKSRALCISRKILSWRWKLATLSRGFRQKWQRRTGAESHWTMWHITEVNIPIDNDDIEGRTVLKKSDAMSSAISIDSAVVSSVRSDLFRDKLKCWSEACCPLWIVHLSSFSSPFRELLTVRIGWVDLQRLQGFSACI